MIACVLAVLPRPSRLDLLILALCVFAFAGYALIRGQDANWDLQNYHLYDAFALLHWRYDRDVAPGGPQTYLNPLADLLPYGLRQLLSPKAAAVVTAALQAVAAFLVWLIARRMAPNTGLALLALATASTGAMIAAEIGTSFADLGLAMLPLAGLLVLMRSAGATTEGTPSARAAASAGFATGLGVGAKPTNVFLLPALAAAILIAPFGRTRNLVAAGVGAVAGGCLTGALWAAFLWRRFCSPMFPFLNGWFRSPDAGPSNVVDPRFVPHGLLHALAIPLQVAAGWSPTAETPFRDARFAVALPLCLVFAVRWELAGGGSARERALAQTSIYVLTGYASWLSLGTIQRYAIPLEFLCGVLAVLLAAEMLTARLAPFAAAAVACGLIASTKPADFWHRPWSSAYVARVPRHLPPSASYLLLGNPLAYWATVRPRPVAAAGLYPDLLVSGSRLDSSLRTIIARPPEGGLWALGLDVPLDPTIRAELVRHGVVLAPPCERAPSMWWVDTVFCRVANVGPRPDAASSFPLARPISFDGQGTGWLYELSGWGSSEADGVWAIGSPAVLGLSVDRTTPLILQATISAVADAPPRSIAVATDHHVLAVWQLGSLGGWRQQDACLPPSRNSTLLLAFITSDTRSLASMGRGVDTRPLAFRLQSLTIRPGRC